MNKILQELNESNSTNYKKEVLNKYKDNKELQNLLKMTYCKVSYTYGISLKNVDRPSKYNNTLSLQEALKMLLNLSNRTYTGNNARSYLDGILSSLNEDNSNIILKVIDRDLKIGIGRTEINKVWKDLVVKFPYMRCGIYTQKTAKKIKYPSFLQIKADGLFQQVIVQAGEVSFISRSGEERHFPILEEYFKDFKEGVYIGEMLVQNISDRSKGNGLINSSIPPHDDVYIQLWDYVTLDEYSRPKDKSNKTLYVDRFKELNDTIVENKHIKLIPTITVHTLDEVIEQTSKWMKDGLEGAILKDYSNIFIDHTSPTQLKLKISFEIDVKITGFIEGKKGTSREETFGSITFETLDGKLKGSVSGFKDKELKDFNSRREELIGRIIEVQANDITKSRDKDTYALSHPRFIELREDKFEADTTERAFEMLEMAKEFKV